MRPRTKVVSHRQETARTQQPAHNAHGHRQLPSCGKPAAHPGRQKAIGLFVSVKNHVMKYLGSAKYMEELLKLLKDVQYKFSLKLRQPFRLWLCFDIIHLFSVGLASIDWLHWCSRAGRMLHSLLFHLIMGPFKKAVSKVGDFGRQCMEEVLACSFSSPITLEPGILTFFFFYSNFRLS